MPHDAITLSAGNNAGGTDVNPLTVEVTRNGIVESSRWCLSTDG